MLIGSSQAQGNPSTLPLLTALLAVIKILTHCLLYPILSF